MIHTSGCERVEKSSKGDVKHGRVFSGESALKIKELYRVSWVAGHHVMKSTEHIPITCLSEIIHPDASRMSLVMHVEANCCHL